MDFLSRLWPAASDDAGNTTIIVACTVVATIIGTNLLRSALWPPQPKVMRGPLQTLIPSLPKHELEKLEYKPGEFPGARDVATPYGSIRVYEWGPEDGPKVLFAHGITTSCQTLGRIARSLVSKGCRVMLMDFFGRGFSDNPGDLPHDERLYVSQMLLALASSPLPWTGAGNLRVIGYSMGGGVAVHFATTFPDLVDRLVLLAPAGVIRLAKFGGLTRFVFRSGLVPDRVLAHLTAERLKKPIAAGVKKPKTATPTPNGKASEPAPAQPQPLLPHGPGKQDPVAAALTEASDPSPAAPAATETALESRVLRYVEWMVRHHRGFVPAFMRSIRDAPLVEQQAAFSLLARRRPGADSTLVILGDRDEIVSAADYQEDALPLLGGRERVGWAVVGGGHDFPMTHANEVLVEICKAWGL